MLAGFGSSTGQFKGGQGGKGGKGRKGGKKGGRTVGTGSKPSRLASLDSEAEALLRQAGGDMNTAQAIHFQQSVMSLRTDSPELFAAIEAQQQTPRAVRADVQEKLIELTWDTVAAFIPDGAAVDAELRRKLGAIAAATCATTATTAPLFAADAAAKSGLGESGLGERSAGARSVGASGGSNRRCAVLDVGCGDGTALPFLLQAGADRDTYVGIDLSSRMISCARRKAPGVQFEKGAFGASALAKPPARYDAVLFNGALQFFDDQAAALKQAAEITHANGGRVVVAHVNGGGFVRDEAAGNPMTVPSTMPSVACLEDMADALGMRLRLPTAAGNDLEAAEKGLDEFYLAVLEHRHVYS
jgi:SAM-dependent methyltransferase